MAKPVVIPAGNVPKEGLDLARGHDAPRELRAPPNTALLHHVGEATGVTRDVAVRLIAANVIAVIEGREPTAPVV